MQITKWIIFGFEIYFSNTHIENTAHLCSLETNNLMYYPKLKIFVCNSGLLFYEITEPNETLETHILTIHQLGINTTDKVEKTKSIGKKYLSTTLNLPQLVAY